MHFRGRETVSEVRCPTDAKLGGGVIRRGSGEPNFSSVEIGHGKPR